MLRLQYFKETGQTDEASRYEQYLRETEQYREATPPTAAAPARVQAPAPETEPGYFLRFATHILNAAQGIPGLEAVEAKAGSLGSKLTNNPMNYEQSLQALREATGNIGSGTSTVEHMMGGLATLPFLPANPAAAGAALGGADQALDADPTESLLARGGKTALGVGVGAITGRYLDKLITGARALPVPGGAMNPEQRMLQMQAERAASASKLYGAARAEGQGKAASPAVQAFLGEPDIAEIVTELQQTRPLKAAAPESPEMLDAVYKTLSDRAATVKKGLESVAPTRPNIGRFRASDIQDAKTQAVDVMSGGTIPGPMPTYRAAVEDFARRTAEMKALGRGADALNESLTGRLLKSRDWGKKGPLAFQEWAKTATPAELALAKQGILDQTGSAFGLPGKTFAPGRRAIGNAGGLLRVIDPKDISSKLAQAGLFSLYEMNR